MYLNIETREGNDSLSGFDMTVVGYPSIEGHKNGENRWMGPGGYEIGESS